MSELVVSNFVDTFVSNVVDKTEYENFKESTDERLIAVEVCSMDNKDELINQDLKIKMLNDWFMVMHRRQVEFNRKIKWLIISNIITGIIAITAVVIALIL